MDVVNHVVQKCLNFPHGGTMQTIQYIRYKPLVLCGGFSLDYFWPTLVGPMLPRDNLLHKAYYKYNIKETTFESILPPSVASHFQSTP